MKTFSVLTVSKRTGWDTDASKCIDSQTILPDEWIIVSEEALNPLNTDGRVPRTLLRAPKKTKLSNLNASLNEGLRHITTDYVIFYQDFIDLKENCFEKLLALATPDTLVTTCTPNYDGSDDSRYLGIDGPRPCIPDEWEANVSIAPMGIIKKLGGFDEEYDWGWSWDNVNLAQRAAMLGCKFILDESNRPKLYPHEMSSHRTLPLNALRHHETMMKISNGTLPLKLKYLDKNEPNNLRS